MNIDTSKIVTAEDRAAQQRSEANAQVMKDLEAIDIASIRSIREWLVAQPNPPQFILDHEATAQVKRGQLQ